MVAALVGLAGALTCDGVASRKISEVHEWPPARLHWELEGFEPHLGRYMIRRAEALAAKGRDSEALATFQLARGYARHRARATAGIRRIERRLGRKRGAIDIR